MQVCLQALRQQQPLSEWQQQGLQAGWEWHQHLVQLLQGPLAQAWQQPAVVQAVKQVDWASQHSS
jgi:hypothetical protein